MTGSGRVGRFGARASALVESRHTVAVAALVAVLLRLPGLTRPIRADEAGFLLVARAWHPLSDAMYSAYWVDRPPLLLTVVKASDAVGGPHFLRVVGALACGLLVLVAARVARLVADEPAARWTAVVVAALTTNTLIDAVAVKGEILALPLIMGSFWLTLVALRRTTAGRTTGRTAGWPEVWPAFAAGLLAVLAMGLKQNLVSGLVFAGVVLVASWMTGRLTGDQAVRLGAAGLAGAATPVLATIGWALAAGVRLPSLGYALFGFRSDAARVISEGTANAPLVRAMVLLSVGLAVGMVLVIGGFLVHVRSEWTDDRVLTAATLAVLVTDVAGLVAGGSYWRDYLYPLVPGTALCAALLARRSSRRGLTMRLVIAASAVSTVVCLAGWTVVNVGGFQEFDEAHTGEALARVAEPGDTLVVFGGRADIQLSSGLPSPYRYLWSLPMRTLDPRYERLRALVTGPDAPTWFVAWVGFGAWANPAGAPLEEAVDDRYVRRGTGCDGHPIYLLKGVDRAPPEPECT